MDLFQVDDDGRLFISAAIEDWTAVARHGIDTVEAMRTNLLTNFLENLRLPDIRTGIGFEL